MASCCQAQTSLCRVHGLEKLAAGSKDSGIELQGGEAICARLEKTALKASTISVIL